MKTLGAHMYFHWILPSEYLLPEGQNFVFQVIFTILAHVTIDTQKYIPFCQ